ncbi:YesL family protein [Alkalihalobacillus pseudalcaliphilus]|uniref:YesL family protein n=1 Tax=Alkalihalobacillus pseudalcaliphilus TaxID=79884 RepID=UPI00064DC95E|nr:DUF624 domain-containing protein [Alkalihalobacillus pseudalcaliphilus]KMK78028.1 hypothetical protein AB990_00820 [Alkalihalobacillus pseudalcaliphilus]
MGRTLYHILEWITRFAYINILWLATTLLGFFFFGLFPATIALFTIMRKWLQGEYDFPIFQRFWHIYKQEFKRSNVFGLPLFIIGSIVGFNLLFLYFNMDITLSLLTALLFAGMLLFGLFIFYVFPTYVHYDSSLAALYKNAFFIMLVSPIQSLGIIVTFVAFSLLIYVFPAIAMIFGSSFYALVTSLFAQRAFQKVEEKQSNIS